MEKIEIRLPRGVWFYYPEKPIGKKGGFGEVFEGEDIDGNTVAIKRLFELREPLIQREIKISEKLISQNYIYILPYFDAGIDSNTGTNFIVMALAKKSLDDYLNEQSSISEREAIAILLNISKGLQEVQEITHRDLKPANILLHNSLWKIADFGIAKFIEESTSANTLKGFLSPPYGSPEQWRGEKSTQDSDIYSLGCIGYKILNGNPPFLGPDIEDYQLQHLNDSPPILENINPKIRTFLSLMLRKIPETRPSVERFIKILEEIGELHNLDDMNSHSLLAEAGALAAEAEAIEEAQSLEEEAKIEKRRELAKFGIRELNKIMLNFEKYIINEAPTADVSVGTDSLTIQLGKAKLSIILDEETDFIEYGDFSDGNSWDILCCAVIEVYQHGYPQVVPGNYQKMHTWQANLLFAKNDYTQEYRWLEVCFYNFNKLTFIEEDVLPFAYSKYNLPLNVLSNALQSISTIKLATSPIPIDAENQDDFFRRWGDKLALAVKGKLEPPSSFPF